MIAAAALLSWSCSKESTDTDDNKEPEVVFDETVVANLTVNRTEYSANSDGASFQLRLNTDYLWRVNLPEDCDWITVDPMSGEAGSNIKVQFTIRENASASERTARLTIQSGKTKKRLNISQARKPRILTEADVPDLDKIYIPQELRSMDFFNSSSRWYFGRSRQSEHFIVFWEKGAQWDEYGDTTPADATNSKLKVDIDDLLRKAEQFFENNINILKFSVLGEGKSTLDKYKMIIMLNYSTDWLATGAGYDNVIGALWVNPSCCQPVGSTIAHEIGHSFQYMVFCDYLLNKGIPEDQRISQSSKQGPGWRYGFEANGDGGNGFWEQTAQWQSFQLYRGEALYNYYAQGFFDCTHLHVLHEAPRYSNYFIHWWWVEQNDDIEFIGKLWRSAEYPEDPCQTYMRLMGYDNDQFNDSIWEYAAHMVTFDCDEIREEGKSYIGKVATTKISANGDYWRIAASQAPETTGFNVIRMTLPSDGKITVNLKGVLDMSGVKCGSASEAGWKYGFVSYNGDGTTSYTDIKSAVEEDVEFEIPSTATQLWFVVTGAPKTYERHAWADESETNDNHWPWEARFTGSKPYGK